MSADLDHAALAREFVEAVGRGADDNVTALLADDVRQGEFPNPPYLAWSAVLGAGWRSR